jgi:aquaglyceroporin related protein
LNSYDPQKLIFSTETGNASASLFITVPNESAGGAVQGFTQEIIATGILTILVLALGDEVSR